MYVFLVTFYFMTRSLSRRRRLVYLFRAITNSSVPRRPDAETTTPLPPWCRYRVGIAVAVVVGVLINFKYANVARIYDVCKNM